MRSTVQAPTAKAGLTQWLGLAVLALPTFLLATDVTVLYLALPELQADLLPSSTQALWIIDMYGFLIAGFLVTMGALGDRIGRRKLLLIGGAAFAVAALGAAYATSAEQLIVARAVMGIAGATLMPSTLALISTMFRDAAQRTSAIGVWAASFSAGIALGPLVGGLLLEHAWWGSVFLVDVPVMLVLLAAGPFLLPEVRDRTAGRIDVTSALLSVGSLLSLVYGFKSIAQSGISVTSMVAVAVGLAVGTVFIRRQKTLAAPVVDTTLFRRREFSAALTILLAVLLALGGVYLFVTQYLQLVAGLSPLAAGLWLLPAAGALTAASLAAPSLARWTSSRAVVTGSLLISTVGYLLLTGVGVDGGVGLLITGFTLVYLGSGPIMVLGTDLIVGAAPAEKAGSAAAISETATELGVALGVAALGSAGTAVYRSKVAADLPGEIPAAAVDAARDSVHGAAAAAADLAEYGHMLTDAANGAFTTALQTAAGIGAVTVTGLAILAAVALRAVTTDADGDGGEGVGEMLHPDGGEPDAPGRDERGEPVLTR